MADPDDGDCYRCEQDRDTATHRLYFYTDRESQTVDLCPPCVRKIREADNPVRSIT